MSEDSTETPSDTTVEVPRYDILLVSQNRALNVVEQGLKSLINYLQASGVVRVYDEAIAENWTEVYAKVGPSSHEMFVIGSYTGDSPVFLEVAIRGGTASTYIPFGGTENETCYFWIEIRGALFNDLTGKFKLKLREVMSTRFDMFTRKHEALPPHGEVGEDEAPVDKKRKRQEGAAQRVGTAVEEF
jgi:hypothetical protein